MKRALRTSEQIHSIYFILLKKNQILYISQLTVNIIFLFYFYIILLTEQKKKFYLDLLQNWNSSKLKNKSINTGVGSLQDLNILSQRVELDLKKFNSSQQNLNNPSFIGAQQKNNNINASYQNQLKINTKNEDNNIKPGFKLFRTENVVSEFQNFSQCQKMNKDEKKEPEKNNLDNNKKEGLLNFSENLMVCFNDYMDAEDKKEFLLNMNSASLLNFQREAQKEYDNIKKRIIPAIKSLIQLSPKIHNDKDLIVTFLEKEKSAKIKIKNHQKMISIQEIVSPYITSLSSKNKLNQIKINDIKNVNNANDINNNNSVNNIGNMNNTSNSNNQVTCIQKSSFLQSKNHNHLRSSRVKNNLVDFDVERQSIKNNENFTFRIGSRKKSKNQVKFFFSI